MNRVGVDNEHNFYKLRFFQASRVAIAIHEAIRSTYDVSTKEQVCLH